MFFIQNLASATTASKFFPNILVAELTDAFDWLLMPKDKLVEAIRKCPEILSAEFGVDPTIAKFA
jgi:hypothetical protein